MLHLGPGGPVMKQIDLYKHRKTETVSSWLDLSGFSSFYFIKMQNKEAGKTI